MIMLLCFSHPGTHLVMSEIAMVAVFEDLVVTATYILVWSRAKTKSDVSSVCWSLFTLHVVAKGSIGAHHWFVIARTIPMRNPGTRST